MSLTAMTTEVASAASASEIHELSGFLHDLYLGADLVDQDGERVAIGLPVPHWPDAVEQKLDPVGLLVRYKCPIVPYWLIIRGVESIQVVDPEQRNWYWVTELTWEESKGSLSVLAESGFKVVASVERLDVALVADTATRIGSFGVVRTRWGGRPSLDAWHPLMRRIPRSVEAWALAGGRLVDRGGGGE